jgi:hypothetical protein
MHIRSTAKANRGEWLELAKAREGTTFFHTPYWHELAVRCGRGDSDGSLQLTLDGGKRVIVPLMERKYRLRGVLKLALSTFGTCYGGPLSREPLTPDEQLAMQELLMRRYASVSLVSNPFWPESTWHHDLNLSGMSTQVLELTEGFEPLLKGFSKGHRAAYTKARREGVQVRRAESPADVSAYHGLYTQALKRWGKTGRSYPLELFQAIVELGVKHPELSALWIAERDGLVLAGAVILSWNGHADYWHGATHEDYHASGATNFLLGEVIRDTCERGFKWFDFNPSGGHENVAAFKRRFGAREMTFEHGLYKHRALRLLDNVRGYVVKARESVK